MSDTLRARLAEALEKIEGGDLRRLAEDEPDFIPLVDILLELLGEDAG